MDGAEGASHVTPSEDSLDMLEHSDVITVVNATKNMARDMFGQVAPDQEKQAENGITAGIEAMTGARDEMDATLAAMSGNPHAAAAVASMQGARDEIDTTISQLQAARDGIPGLFEEAEENYLSIIDEHASDIQHAFQKQLNTGFAGMFGFMSVCCAIGLALTMLYRDSSRKSKAKDKTIG